MALKTKILQIIIWQGCMARIRTQTHIPQDVSVDISDYGIGTSHSDFSTDMHDLGK